MAEETEHYKIRVMVSGNDTLDNSKCSYRANIYISGKDVKIVCAKTALPLKNIETEIIKISEKDLKKINGKKGNILWEN